MKLLRLTVSAFIAFQAAPAYAWNSHGHMTVAAVAYKQLTSAVRMKVDALVRLNPDYPGWVANVPESRRDLVAFLLASTWPDQIRHDSTHTSSGDLVSAPAATRNIGYVDALVHPYWHYINLPLSPDGTPEKAPVAPNVQTQIVTFGASLASPTTSDDVKSYDLVWLLHLVGDVHQPLHAVSRFDRQQPDGDRGGNLVAIRTPAGQTNLHSFWDDALGISSAPDAAIEEANRLPAPDSRLAAIASEATWIDESFALAKAVVYVDPVAVGPGPFTVDAQYTDRAHEIAAKRVALAGVRLANLLNDALKATVVGARGAGQIEATDPHPGATATQPTVLFNEQTHKYHDPACIWAKRCTRHCVSLPLSDAISRGGTACKVCGGGRRD